ncbi:GTPase [candidate division KSB1 bacterium]
MPANLTPQFHEAENKYRIAKDNKEKLMHLEEMLKVIPKHKGTEKIQGDIKSRIAKLRKEPDKKSKMSHRGSSMYQVEKEGAAQVVLAGMPNTGKSSFLASVTNAEPCVAEYPLSTLKPIPGMMQYENIQIQLVDLIPINPEYFEPWVVGIIRNSDAVLIFVNLSEDPVTELEETLKFLEEKNIFIVKSLEEIDYEFGNVYKRALIAANMIDLDENEENLEILSELYQDRFDIIPVSSKYSMNLDNLKVKIFRFLDILRVYSKPPRKEPDLSQPMVFPIGTTVIDVARSLHKDFVEKFKFARIWGDGKYEGQKVNRDYVVVDGDVIEFHI